MTVANSLNKHTYVGNGLATQFSYTFKIFKTTDIQVILTEMSTGVDTILTSNYSINTTTNIVTYPTSGTPLTAAYKLTLNLKVPITQEMSLPNQGAYMAKTIEKAFDKVVIIEQQLQEQLSRSLVHSISVGTDVSNVLPAPVAGKTFCWNEDGTKLVSTPTSGFVAYETYQARDAAIAAQASSESASAISVMNANNASMSAISASINSTASSISATSAASSANLANLTVESIADIYKTTQAILFADLAHAADVTAMVLNDPINSNNGRYIKLGASGTGSWQKSSYESPVLDKSIIPSKLNDNLQRIIMYGKDIQNPYSIHSKLSAGEKVYFGFLFDLNGLPLIAGDKYTISFDYYTEDNNVTSIGFDLFMNDSSTLAYYGSGTSFTIHESDGAIIHGLDTNYTVIDGKYVPGYRYAHLFIAATPTNSAVLSQLFIGNLKFKIGNIDITNIIETGLFNQSTDSSFAQVWHDYPAVTSNVATIANNALNTANKCGTTIREMLGYDYTNPMHFTGNTTLTSGEYMYCVQYVYDLTNVTLANTSNYNVKYDYFTKDTNINGLAAQVFINNSPTDFTGGDNWVMSKQEIVKGEIGDINTSGGVYNSTYKYAHVFVTIFVNNLTSQTELYFADLKLSIGGVEIPLVDLISVSKQSVTSTSKLVPEWFSNPIFLTEEKVKDINDRVVALEGGNGLRFANSLLNCMGDSITYGVGTTKTYHSYLHDWIGVTARNYGIPSSTIADNPVGLHDSMAIRYSTMDSNADIVTVFAGTNDHGLGQATKGTFFSSGTTINKDITTFYGACHVLFEGLVKKYAARGATIVIITPTPKSTQITTVNPYSGMDLEGYVNIIQEVATYYSLPVLDLFRTSGLQSAIPEIQANYFYDYIHPAIKGHEVIAHRLLGYMRTI